MTVEKGTPDVRVDLFGGQGTVRVWSLLGDAAEPFTAVLSCELVPGGSVGRHVQEEFPELVVGLSGDGDAWVGEELHALSAGDTVYLPLGSVLSIANRSSVTSLRYLIIKARR
jgi:quercetin dioxygenase-like cupin family protein